MDDMLQQLKKMRDLLQQTAKKITPAIALVHPHDIDEILQLFTAKGLLYRREYFLNAQEKYVIYSDYGIAQVTHAYIFLSSDVNRGEMAMFDTTAGITSFTRCVRLDDLAT